MDNIRSLFYLLFELPNKACNIKYKITNGPANIHNNNINKEEPPLLLFCDIITHHLFQ